MLNRIDVFAGPSLPQALRPDDPRLVWRPPAQAGDCLDPELGPTVVLIDGLFDGAPAVRHKELLGLIDRGVTVIGAASMGALRAAELSAFGMRGVGRIFTAYAHGCLTGDDEVALLHGPQEADWRPLTEPLVEVRATLLAARRDFALGVGAARWLLELAKGTFYQERTWERLLERGSEPGFEDWLTEGRVKLKTLDALAAIDIALGLAEPSPARHAAPRTQFTEALAQACAH